MNLLKFAKSIIWTLFPPERPVERVIRTQYHRITSTSWYVNRTLRRSAASYGQWMEHQRKILSSHIQPVMQEPHVTFLVNSGQINDLNQTLNSIQRQIGGNSSVVIVTSESTENPSNPSVPSAKSLHKAIYAARGTYFVCCAAGDQFDDYFLQQFRLTLAANAGASVIYTDNDEIDASTQKPRPLFKPSAYSPELLLSINYLSRALINIETAKGKSQFIDPDASFFAQERELLFRICESGIQSIHIPFVLVHQIQPKSVPGSEDNKLIQEHLIRSGFPASVRVEQSSNTRIRWDFGAPSISIIIPTKNSCAVLKNLLTSLFEKTSYLNYEILLVDNGSDQPEVLAYYSELKQNPKVRIIPFNEPFNYSKANNLGAANSQAEYLLFLNNDMEVIHPDWLTELVQWASRPEIGIVGTKLLHANRSIQHAGVVLGLQNFVGHLYLNTPEHYHGLLGSVDWYRDVSAVTGACQMMRRSTFQELGGFDEAFTLVFSDVALCLQALTNGYRVLYTPYACLLHLEGGSRVQEPCWRNRHKQDTCPGVACFENPVQDQADCPHPQRRHVPGGVSE